MMRIKQVYCTLVTFCCFLLLTASNVLTESPLELGPMLGHVGSTEARIWAKASDNATMGVLIGQKADLSDGRVVKGPVLAEGSAFMGHVHVTGLEASKQYYYAVLLDGQQVTEQPYPSFHTAVLAEEPTQLRVAFTSCVARTGEGTAGAWEDLAKQANADIILQLGDNHYADTTDPDIQRNYYYEQRNLPGFRKATAEAATYGIWDDHDYGPNNSDRTARGKELSLRTFKEHWANPSYGEPDNPGIYYSFTRGDVQFIMLDVRYHRDPNNMPETGEKTMLGQRQKKWLKEQLLASKAKIKFIASGSEWQLNSHNDSWTSFHEERLEIFNFIHNNEITGVILLSGDRHMTAAYQINGRLIEVTSGPMKMANRTLAEDKVPDMFLYNGTGMMYSVFEVDTHADPVAVKLEVYEVGNGIVKEHNFTWNEINGQQRIPPLH